MDQDATAYHDESIRLKRKIAGDDPDAFEQLCDRHGSLLEQILAGYHDHHMSTEDFIQEVFTRLWQQRKNFRGQSRFLTYLSVIARHTVNEEIRRSGKMTVRDLEEEIYINRDSHHDLAQPEAELFLKELTTSLEKIRARLTAKQRQASISLKPQMSLCAKHQSSCVVLMKPSEAGLSGLANGRGSCLLPFSRVNSCNLNLTSCNFMRKPARI